MITFTRSLSLAASAFLVKAIGIVVPLFSTPWGIGSIFAPAIGYFATTLSCIGLYSLRSILVLALYGDLTIGVTYLPTLAGSLVLATQSRAFKVAIPALCIGLFSIHPVGQQSVLYTGYWLIPIGLGYMVKPNIFLKSLASTMTTHAVGSVIFIYSHTTTSTFWHALIARVWYERLVYALLLTLSYFLISTVIKLITTLRAEGKVCQSPLPSL